MTDSPNVSLKSLGCSLFTRRVLIVEPNHRYLRWNLEKELADYNYMETAPRTLINPSRKNQFIQVGSNKKNNCCNEHKFNCCGFFRKFFQLSTISFERARTIRVARAIVSLDTTSPCRLYVTKLKAMQFNEVVPALPMKDFQNHYNPSFDLTSLQDAAERLHYSEDSG